MCCELTEDLSTRPDTGASWPIVDYAQSVLEFLGGHFQDVRGKFASAVLFEKLLSLTSKHFSYEYSDVVGC